ncbi:MULTISPECIES: ImuA family protein [Sphingobium]|uniref:ImuA family protein n=1 Tax=Sphingobium TaxID=165695 RepID=UPI0015EC733C|nr:MULTISPECIES: hypothetical protein [Sphingobium]MCW2362620.1 protein ImuA [Sphingobium sp. B10D3B]MCW2381043.1 protein ImuA [Sphingobium sp. B2D3B]MCW2388819.1 protein ImuA [Sphingobium sp. B11D3B]MCW2398850.1 protein ImuA [Sphingobium sp. B2D3C]MCW2400700.1 protein ImuA [Sphingobium sp. B10D7B]
MRLAPALLCDHAMPDAPSRKAFGIAAIDTLLGGGLARGRVHEVYAAEVDDVAAAAGFVVSLATGLSEADGKVLWLRERQASRKGGVAQGHGWAELGGAPGLGLIGTVRDGMDLLRAAVDALRCSGLSAVVVEGWGPMPALDLTASRRLTLAAEKSGVTLLLLRPDAPPVPSAGQTRWQVAAAPSLALPGNAPGLPTFDVTLLRQRSGPCGLSWRLEWDRDRRLFREAALSGAVVSAPAHRKAADSAGDRQRGDRRAA